ncbi:MAG: GNAT family N-acetyltransferase [Acidobacteria bacterium]|nr:MAG: GNAT family N-acetyltransferase [Acidobacteriota bacterium]REJ99001.1 MAG: GNAT family N-acetyltransferase [Acidobacteriota bacterium]REK16279.1 MAG: GNAT family N-acetyltransferase [Acidobacteriota bacterium]REK43960.1 MAG: GNAT family N-acetyltransferase [Acidobacteriota bacterium]
MSILVRRALPEDRDRIVEIDSIAGREPERLDYVAEFLEERHCFIAEEDGVVEGYGVMDHSFFGRGFISLVFVKEDRRRSGIGSALFERLEAECSSKGIFTSTNASNLGMQAFLGKRGYRLSGLVDNLDKDDPELFFFKDLGC